VAVERSTQALLVQMVTDESDAASEDEQTVEGTNLDVLISLLGGERTTVTEEIDEADGDASIDIQDKL
jgi:hypothetical protein